MGYICLFFVQFTFYQLPSSAWAVVGQCHRANFPASRAGAATDEPLPHRHCKPPCYTSLIHHSYIMSRSHALPPGSEQATQLFNITGKPAKLPWICEVPLNHHPQLPPSPKPGWWGTLSETPYGTSLAQWLSWLEHCPVHPKCCWFNPNTGHMPGFRVWSPVRMHAGGG